MEKETHLELSRLLTERLESMKLFTPDYEPVMAYAVFRKDLNMTEGKLAAQCGHAFHEVIQHCCESNPELMATYKGSGHGTKIVMYVKNQGQLLRVYDELKAKGVPCFMVIDRGHVIPDSQFTGEPILTAIGFGPCTKDSVAEITKRCTMVR